MPLSMSVTLLYDLDCRSTRNLGVLRNFDTGAVLNTDSTTRIQHRFIEDPGQSLYMLYPSADRNGQKIGMMFDPNRIFWGKNVTNVRYFMRTDHLSRY